MNSARACVVRAGCRGTVSLVGRVEKKAEDEPSPDEDERAREMVATPICSPFLDA